MPKILVADDNSNIQKMVGLALKDQGIDVVAVGNGEAAVRKISDIHPDLVLADVFMPVRNGYEVCQYVKSDPALAHIPVILLVGAFDPLDEQEAQRVGADGVLKKPFVPPDPLISMVKSALARVGALAAEKVVEPPPPIKATDLIGTPAAHVPTIAVIPSIDDSANGDSRYSTPAPVRIDANAPLAFGNLLETSVVSEKEEEDPAFVASVHPELAADRDWRAGAAEETEEEEESKSSWRRGGENEALEDTTTSTSNTARDWRDTNLAEMPTRQSSREAWEPTKEKIAIAEAAEDQVGVSARENYPAPTSISVGKPSSAPAPFAGDAWAAAISAGNAEERASQTISEVAPEATSEPVEAASAYVSAAVETVAVEQSLPAVQEPEVHQQPAAQHQPEAAAEVPRSSTAESWFSPAPSPWDAEIKKAAQLASGWDSPNGNMAPPAVADAPVAQSPIEEPLAAAPVEEHAAALESPSVEAVAQEAGLSSTTVEQLREEAAIVAEGAVAESATPAPAAPAQSHAQNMDDLVAKVLANMSPETLQAVTREILRPVVEAMVRDELNAKKS